MNKKTKEFIEQAIPYELGTLLGSIYIISTGKLYKGFWGKNGYNNIIVIGRGYGQDDNLYLINKDYECDVLFFYKMGEHMSSAKLDIPHDLNCVHIWFSPVHAIYFDEIVSGLTPKYKQMMK